MKLFKSKFVASLLVFVLLLSVMTFQVNAESTLHSLGWIPPTSQMMSSMPKAQTLMSALSLPSLVDLSSNFPTPGYQGSQGSCTTWATTYAYKSYQEKLDHQWNLDNPFHVFSPSYVYNQLNGGVDKGCYIGDALDLMVQKGVCSIADMPYNAADYTTQPNSYQNQKASEHKALSWGYLPSGDVASMKNYLATNNAVVIGIPVYPDFDNLSSSNQVYDTISGTLRGYHAICLVGYDDSKSAFKFINSWGTSWGLSGYGYMSYNLVQQLATTGYVMQDIPEPVRGEWNMEGLTSTNMITDKYGMDGTTSGTTTFSTGIVGQAINFSGSNYVNIPNYSRYNNMNNFTLSAWVYPTNRSDGEYIISKTTPNRDFVLVIVANGNLQFHIAHSATYKKVNGNIIPLNTWTHVAAVYANGTITLYENGVATATSTLDTFAPPDWTGTLMQIGAMSSITGFHGKIDEVNVFSKALSSSEIATLFNNR